jgi:hypothetical protein
MSINGLQQQYFANSLDGLTYLDVNGIAINGNDIDIDNLVPYTGANKTIDVGVQPIRTSYNPVANNDVVNLVTLQNAITYVDGVSSANFVRYTGSLYDVDLGSKNIKTTHTPSSTTDLTNKGYVDTADALRIPYTGATSNVNLGSNSIIATTAQFTGVTSATPSLALGVDGSGNLRSFAVPSGSAILSLNNTWTGTNDFNNNFSAGKNAITATLTATTWNQPYWTAGTGTAAYSYNTGTTQGTAYGNIGVSSFTLNSTGLTAGYGQTYQMTITNMVFSTPSSGGVYFEIRQSGTVLYNSGFLSTYTSTTRSFNFAVQANGTSLSIIVYDYAGASSQPYFFFGTITLTALSTTLSNPYVSGTLQIGSASYPTPTAITAYGDTSIVGATSITGIITATGIATGTPATTIGLNSSNQLVKYTNPVSAVFTGSVSSTYIPYASSANVFANSIMSQSGTQINIAGTLYASDSITSGGDMICGLISPSSGYGRLDDRSLRPKDINAGTEQFFFASWNNDGGGPFADAIGMNGWSDSSGGNTNVLMVRKDTYGIRQYQGTFGSTTAFTSAQYMDCCMKGVGDNTKTTFQPVGGSWNVPLVVGSGTDSGLAQVITTDGNLHLDPRSGYAIYLGYYRNPTYIYGYASSGMTNFTRYWTQYADVNGDASMYLANQNGGSSAYYNLIIHGSGGNVNHFLNSASRTADGGQNCYTIRNDTGGGVRFTGTNGGFSSYVATGTGGATYTNAIVNYQNGAGTGNIGTWAGYGFTLFCNTTQPAGSQAALGIVSSNTTTNFVVSLSPGIRWMDIQVWAATHYHYYYGAMAAYLVGGGWVNVSDEREKEDINDLKTSRSLERILKCKPKYYKRKYYDVDADGKPTTPATQSTKDTICIGLLAQDVLQTNPHCVSGWKNDNIKETDNDDGTRYGINYGDFTVHLIGAVQEQQKMIETLTERSKVMEEHARDLETQLSQSRKDLEEYKSLTEERFNKLAKMISGK